MDQYEFLDRSVVPPFGKLIDLTREDHAQVPDATYARQIGALSRAVRFELGPPWEHEPDRVDRIAAVLSDAVSTIGDTNDPEVRTQVVNILQRMIFMLEDKHGPVERDWMAKMEEMESAAPPAQVTTA